MAWSIAGKRVEFRAGFPAGKLVVTNTPKGTPEHELKLATKGEWQLPVGVHSVKVVRTSQFAGPKLELFGASGALIPPTDQHLVPGVAPEGSQCPSHQVAATYACARCGTFVCAQCAGVDFTHCQTCLASLTEVAQKNSAAAAYFAPVIVFAIFGGLLGGLFAGAAGAAAVAIAKRTEHKAIKIGAAVVLYGIAAVAWILIAASLRR
ncbi:MAG: hypothetical protein JNM69_01895 [Archangium sp.]|nr:hypothetical protein [Archangium sp.]